LGFAYLPAIVAVSFYFEKRRSLATGLAVCGSGIGTFVFAPITQALLELYSWKGTVLIETGMLLNVILCGMVFRPLVMPAVDANGGGNSSDIVTGNNGVANGRAAELEKNDDEMLKTVDGSVAIPQSVDSKVEDGRRRAQSESWMIRDSKPQAVVSPSILKTSNSKITVEDGRRRTQSESWMKEAKARASASTTSQPPVLKMMSRKDVFYTQSLVNIPMYKNDPNMYHKSITSVAEVDGTAEEGKHSICGKDVWHTLSELMDLRLMLDVVFVLFAISNFLTSIGFVVPYIFLPARGRKRGLSESESAWLISAVGISNTIGRVVFGYIADFKFVNRLMMYNTALVLCGVASIGSSVCFNFALLMVYSFIFGLLIGMCCYRHLCYLKCSEG
jgi:Major Facilitator Superfamily